MYLAGERWEAEEALRFLSGGGCWCHGVASQRGSGARGVHSGVLCLGRVRGVWKGSVRTAGRARFGAPRDARAPRRRLYVGSGNAELLKERARCGGAASVVAGTYSTEEVTAGAVIGMIYSTGHLSERCWRRRMSHQTDAMHSILCMPALRRRCLISRDDCCYAV